MASGTLSKVLGISCALLFISSCGSPWTPSGGWQRADDNRCDPRRLENSLLALPSTARERADFVSQYLNDCDSELNSGSPGFYETASWATQVQYDYWTDTDLRNLDLVSVDGTKIHAQLIMREGNTPRPLIIVKCGLECELNDPSLRYIAAHLHDAAPFHLHFLPSNTSIPFEKENGRVAVGGFDEGRDILRLARYLQSPGFRGHELISEISVLGLSLGSHAALYSALYNSFAHDAQGKPYIKSVMAACPVVDLQASVTNIFSDNIFGHIMKGHFFGHIEGLIDYVPFLQNFYRGQDREHLRDFASIPDLIVRGGLDYYKEATRQPNWGLEPMRHIQITNEASYWAINRFQDFAKLNTTPTVLWASADDQVVSPIENFDVLKKAVGDDPDSPYTFIRSDRGYHCNFTEGYGWRAASSAIRNLVLAEHPSLVSRRRVHRTQITDLRYIGRSAYIPNAATRTQVQWRADPGKSDLTVIEQLRYICDNSGARRGIQGCTVYRYSAINQSIFGFSSPPTTPGDAQARTRWLNSNVWFWGPRAGTLAKRDPLTQVEWNDWQFPR